MHDEDDGDGDVREHRDAQSRLSAKSLSALAVCSLNPPEIAWTAPIISALLAIVTTSGGRPKYAMTTPLSTPNSEVPRIATTIAVARSHSVPNLATMSAPSVTAPGIDRSSPPCWITSVCPIATTAMSAANGSIDTIAVGLTLPIAMSGLTAKSATTAMSARVPGHDSTSAGSDRRSTGADRSGAVRSSTSVTPSGSARSGCQEPSRCASGISPTM